MRLSTTYITVNGGSHSSVTEWSCCYINAKCDIQECKLCTDIGKCFAQKEPESYTQ